MWEGWETYTEQSPSWLLPLCPSARSCGDSGLEPTSKSSSQESSLAWGCHTARDCALLGFQDGKEGSMALQSLQEGDHKGHKDHKGPQ